MTLRGICTVSKWKPWARAVSSMWRWIAGLLWPVKPMKRIFPAARASTSASIAPPGPNDRSASFMRMTSWICTRSMTSVRNERSDCSICPAAAAFVRPSIFVLRNAFDRYPSARARPMRSWLLPSL